MGEGTRGSITMIKSTGSELFFGRIIESGLECRFLNVIGSWAFGRQHGEGKLVLPVGF